MISSVLLALERGLGVIKSNSRFMLVGMLVFIFPLLFVWVTQSFFVTANNNIDTTEKRRTGMIHDSIISILKNTTAETDLLNSHISSIIAADNDDISEITVFSKTDESLLVLASNKPDDIGNKKDFPENFRDVALDFQMREFLIDKKRIVQALSSVTVENINYYILTEQDLTQIYSVINYRQQQSYEVLTVIFLFLIALAYWLNRQVNWEKHHAYLAQQVKERDLFTNMIAHEFRTPLTAIKGYASFLQEAKSLSQEEMGFVGNIRTASERLVILVNDFLEVSRLQSGKLQIERTETDVRSVVSNVTQDLQKLAHDKNLSLTYNAPDLPVILLTDPIRLTQVLTNMVSNAIKYTEKGGVELEVTDTRAGVTIRIKDTGTGISAEDQRKLFTPFTRVGGVDQSNITGTGLGMWITQQLVTLLGGTVGIESIKGVGTHVVINFKDQ